MNYWEQLLERTRQQQADKPFLFEAYDSKGGLPEPDSGGTAAFRPRLPLKTNKIVYPC